MRIEDSMVEPEELEGKLLVITGRDSGEDFGEMFAEFLEGDEMPSVKQLRPETIRKLITPARRQLINHLLQEQPESITEVSEDLGRGLKEVHQDLKFLEEVGVLYFEQSGRAKKPVIPYRDIDLRMRLGETGLGETEEASA